MCRQSQKAVPEPNSNVFADDPPGIPMHDDASEFEDDSGSEYEPEIDAYDYGALFSYSDAERREFEMSVAALRRQWADDSNRQTDEEMSRPQNLPDPHEREFEIIAAAWTRRLTDEINSHIDNTVELHFRPQPGRTEMALQTANNLSIRSYDYSALSPLRFRIVTTRSGASLVVRVPEPTGQWDFASSEQMYTAMSRAHMTHLLLLDKRLEEAIARLEAGARIPKFGSGIKKKKDSRGHYSPLTTDQKNERRECYMAHRLKSITRIIMRQRKQFIPGRTLKYVI